MDAIISPKTWRNVPARSICFGPYVSYSFPAIGPFKLSALEKSGAYTAEKTHACKHDEDLHGRDPRYSARSVIGQLMRLIVGLEYTNSYTYQLSCSSSPALSREILLTVDPAKTNK